MEILSKYDSKVEGSKSLWQVADDHKETKLDTSFQRKGGLENNSGWKKKNYPEYMGNLLDGQTANFIVRVDIKEALKFAKEEEDVESQKYFEQYLRKDGSFEHNYVSADGYNSSSTIYHFFNAEGDKAIPMKDPKSGKEKLFRAMNDDDQMKNKCKTIPVVTLRRISYREMCELFRFLNKQTSLNAQEYRNACPTELASFVRDVANEELEEFFTLMMTENSIDKRTHEQIVATFCLMIREKFDIDANKKALDSLYENVDSLSPDQQRKMKAIAKITSDAIGLRRKEVEKEDPDCEFKLKITAGQLYAWWHLLDIVAKNELKIKNPLEFFKYFLKRDQDLITKSKGVKDEDKNEKSYRHWRDRRQTSKKCFERMRKALELQLLGDSQGLIDQGILAIVRTSKDRFSFEEQKVLWTLQEEKTRDGELIELIDLYTTDKYETDHCKRVADGGKTEPANGEVKSKKDNRSGNQSSSEPFFPHQKEEQEEQMKLPLAI